MEICWGLLFVFWCGEPKVAPPPTDNYCKIYRPVQWSKDDTRLTKEQVDTNNKIWKQLCVEKSK